MDLALAGHRTIVTGAAAGIGLTIARAFLSEGARVAICDIDEAALGAALAANPGLSGWRCDVTDRAAVDGFMERALAELGGLDTLVNNAGTAGPTAAIEDIDPEAWDACLAACLTSQFNFARRAVPALKASANGSMINLSSLAGKLGFALRTPYAAAKWGVIGLTKSLAIELGPHNIRVNAILPGLVAGDRQRRVLEAKAQRLGQSFAEIEARAFGYTSIREYVTAQQLADQCLLLASHRGRTVSGQAIAIDGDTQMLA